LSWRGRVLNPVPTPAPSREGRGRRAWSALVRALSDIPVAVWIILATNVAVSGFVLASLWRILRTLSQAICVIGGENLVECMRYLK
jgi:hypothetical protein